MDDNIAISIQNVSKQFKLPHEKVSSLKGAFTSMFNRDTTYSTQKALNDISFEIKKGEFFGIVGRNGSGKSTLLKIIAGIYQPTEGSVRVSGKLVPFIELGVGFNPELTGRENVYLNGSILGFSKKQIDGYYDDVVEFAELEQFMDQKLKNYSSGMQVRLAFACATRAEADILLVDEVLAVGDADFQRKCFDYFRQLKKLKKTVVFVTHDMNSVREYCDRALLINESRIYFEGDADKTAQEYSKLFLTESKHAKTGVKATKSWGSGIATFKGATANKIGDSITVVAQVECVEDVERIVYGLHVASTDGQEIMALNNRMIHSDDIISVKSGDLITIRWEMLNIFSDGRYDVTLTMVKPNGDVIEWHNEICSFTIKREERSTTAVLPPITVSLERKKED